MVCNLKIYYSLVLKTFKNIICFLILSVFFTVSVGAGNVTFLDNSIYNSVEKEHSLQAKSNLGMYLFVDTEIEWANSTSEPDTLPSSLDDEISSKDGLLKRSYNLSLTQNFKLQNYNRDFFSKTLVKEIIFPFHSFW